MAEKQLQESFTAPVIDGVRVVLACSREAFGSRQIRISGSNYSSVIKSDSLCQHVASLQAGHGVNS